MPYYLPKWLHHFIFLLNEWKFLINENYWCFLCLPAINRVYVLDFRHSNRYVAISCSFSCKLPSNKWCWSSSHMFIFPLCMFCPEMFIQGFPTFSSVQFSSVQLLSHVRLFATAWTAARQASLSITSSQSLPKLMSIKSVVLSNRLILCRPLLLPTLLSFKFLFYILDISPLSDMWFANIFC